MEGGGKGPVNAAASTAMICVSSGSLARTSLGGRVARRTGVVVVGTGAGRGRLRFRFDTEIHHGRIHIVRYPLQVTLPRVGWVSRWLKSTSRPERKRRAESLEEGAPEPAFDLPIVRLPRMLVYVGRHIRAFGSRVLRGRCRLTVYCNSHEAASHLTPDRRRHRRPDGRSGCRPQAGRGRTRVRPDRRARHRQDPYGYSRRSRAARSCWRHRPGGRRSA